MREGASTLPVSPRVPSQSRRQTFFDSQSVHKKFTHHPQVFHRPLSLDALRRRSYASDMKSSREAGLLVAAWLALAVPIAHAQDTPQSGASMYGGSLLLRLFLMDGTSLVSYGEPARVGDRVVFSLPTSDAPEDPRLQLVTIPADRVDWQQTDRYAEASRAAAYIATHAERDYASLTAQIGQALNDVALTSDAAQRLAIVEQARRALAAWPASHYGYKADEIAGMLEILDEAIANLRTVVGLAEFDLSFVDPAASVQDRMPLLPPPTPREAIEQTLAAARLVETPAERLSLMTAALASIDREFDRLPSEWRTSTKMAVEWALAAEERVDQEYRQLTTRTLQRAESRARAADVRGLERLLAEIHRDDNALGGRRPDTIGGLVSTVEERLDAARRLTLDRERWSIRLPELQKFRAVVNGPIRRLDSLKRSLEDIRAMALSTPASLASVEQTASQVLEIVSPLTAPEEMRAAHSLLVSAAQLATSAARIRREAALAGDLSRAWDASSAAAGALMLTGRIHSEIQAALSPPQLAQ